MPIALDDPCARFTGICAIEEGDALLAWLETRPEGPVDLSACEHLHTALFQILWQRPVRIVAMPTEPFLARWLPPHPFHTP